MGTGGELEGNGGSKMKMPVQQFKMKMPVQQLWTLELPWEMQTVMIQGLRAPDTHYCSHIKVVSRWLRSIVLNNADNGHTFMCRKKKLPTWDKLENELSYCSVHFTNHFLYALEIVAYRHPSEEIRQIAYRYYFNIVEGMMHFHVEAPRQLEIRLSDVENVPDLKLEVKAEFKQVKQCPAPRYDSYLSR
jgi:hypothetical protein